MGFFLDAAVVKEASRWAGKIMSTLALDQDVEVYVGPPGRSRNSVQTGTTRNNPVGYDWLPNGAVQLTQAPSRAQSTGHGRPPSLAHFMCEHRAEGRVVRFAATFKGPNRARYRRPNSISRTVTESLSIGRLEEMTRPSTLLQRWEV